MVPVTAERLIADAQATLESATLALDSEPVLHRAVAAWLAGQPPPADVLRSLETRPAPRHYAWVALAAVAEAARWASDSTLLDEGLEWLSTVALDRVGAPAPITTDAVAQLAIAPAVRQRPRLEPWFERVLRHAPGAREPAWAGGGAPSILGSTPSGSSHAALRLSLEAAGLAKAGPDEERAVLEALLRDTLPSEPLHAAVLLSALAWIRRSVPTALPGRAHVEDVIVVLENMQAGLMQWTWETHGRKRRTDPPIRWDVTSEYHVQNLLWLVLRPIFPDLKAEEYVPSTGHHQPRVDLFIPSLRLVIEVKYLAKRGQKALREFTIQLEADASAYTRADSPADQMVVFIWDDTNQDEQHARMKAGVASLPQVAGVIIVSRPGKMARQAAGDDDEDEETDGDGA
jgi:hypothetical protein